MLGRVKLTGRGPNLASCSEASLPASFVTEKETRQEQLPYPKEPFLSFLLLN